MIVYDPTEWFEVIAKPVVLSAKRLRNETLESGMLATLAAIVIQSVCFMPAVRFVARRGILSRIHDGFACIYEKCCLVCFKFSSQFVTAILPFRSFELSVALLLSLALVGQFDFFSNLKLENRNNWKCTDSRQRRRRQRLQNLQR